MRSERNEIVPLNRTQHTCVDCRGGVGGHAIVAQSDRRKWLFNFNLTYNIDLKL